MNLADVLLDGDRDLPRGRATSDYAEDLRTLVASYCDAVAATTSNDDVTRVVRRSLPAIAAMGDGLAKVFTLADGGSNVASTAQMQSVMGAVSEHVRRMTSKPVSTATDGKLFRVCRIINERSPSRARLFHVPFERPEWAESGRYSRAGEPKLYLGQSVKGCLQERPGAVTDDLWGSAFRVADGMEIKALNLAYRPGTIGAMLEQEGGPSPLEKVIAISYASIWPLFAACSFLKGREDSPEEYIVPQHLMAYVQRSGIVDGIRYFSTRVNYWGNELHAVNWAFATTPGQSTGHCAKLAGVFEVTQPLAIAGRCPTGSDEELKEVGECMLKEPFGPI